MAGFYGLHYFMFWCVVVASGGAGQSDGGICGVVSRLEALQAQLAKAEQDATASSSVLAPQLQSINSELQLLSTNLTELAECVKINCPDGFQPCGDVCYQLESDFGTWCDFEGAQYTVPRSQQHITCLLDLTSDTSLPVYTVYRNENGTHFTSWYDSSVVAPAELIDSELGPGGNTGSERFVIIARNSGQLVRTAHLDSGFVHVCEKSPLE